MTESWKKRIAHFNDVPVVDFFGIIDSSGGGGWSSLEQKYPPDPEQIGSTSLSFDVWRIGNGEIQTTSIRMTILVGYKEWNSLVSYNSGFRAHSIVHFKAKIAQHPIGFQEALSVEWIGYVTNDAELNQLQRQLAEPIVLDLPPLPPLQLSTYSGSWNGTIVLSSWNEFHLQSDPNYGGNRGAGLPLSIGSAPLPAVMLGYKGVPPSPEQIAAYVYLIENQKLVQDSLLQAILDVYPQWQKNWGGDPEYMPDVTSLEQFEFLLMLWSVSINTTAKEGYAYVYLSLLPNWDIEHGLGAIMHKNRVVAVGDHDSIWEADQRDLGIEE